MAVKFLGASVLDFTSSLGWGDSPSTCTINLAEDIADGDSFQTPTVGAPYVFSYQTWQFGGIIQSWRARAGSAGNPVYEVVMVDPRDLLSGVSVILGGYNGSTNGVANLLNVYGYLENQQFGSAQRNEAGMPWYLVKNGIVALTKSLAPTYGDAIAIGPYNFEINLDDLPSLPIYYRIGSDRMTILEFCKEVCDAANHDYFFSMNFDKDGNRYITISTVNRNQEPVFGAITNFLSSTPGAIQKDAGFEFRQETTGKFLVGGPLSDIFFRSANVNQADPWNNTIWPFWGYTNDGRLLIGEGENDAHTVTIDASWMPEWGGDTYSTDVAEMRAAKEGIDSWKRFLCINNHNKYRVVEDGKKRAKYRNSNVEYEHNNDLNPHYGKASAFKLEDENWMLEVVGSLETLDDLANITLRDFRKRAINRARYSNDNIIQEQIINQMYGYINQFANEYYGKKFMVILPDIDAAFEPETNQILYSAEPDTSGFIDENNWLNAANNNLLPLDINKFSEENGKIKAFVRFDNYQNLDLGELSENDVAIGKNGVSVFVRCEVEPVLSFKDGATLESPRAVITLPGAVKEKIAITKALNHGPYKLIVDSLYYPLAAQTDENDEKVYEKEEIRSAIRKQLRRAGADRYLAGVAAYALKPDVAAIPVRSNIATYGPWVAIGANGKMEFEQDESLVPWNYGGFGPMNLSAEARVVQALSNYQQSESGSIEVPGIPTINLGDALVSSGPYVTDINVSISSAGIITTYRMNTWTPQPYKTSKNFADSVTRISKTQQAARRNAREQRKNALRTISVARTKQLVRALGKRRSSTHDLMWGETIQDVGDAGRGASVVFGPDYDLQVQLAGDFKKKGAQSLDVMYRPFSMDPDQEELPVVEIEDDNLNPFKDSDFYFMTSGDDSENAIFDPMHEDFDDTKVRALAYRVPMIFIGYGKDVGGRPVPSGDDGQYIPNHKQRSDLWKAGPLDVRWNDQTKMWTMNKCEARNEVHQVFVLGDATDGTFAWTLSIADKSGVTHVNPITFNYNETASSFAEKMYVQHSGIEEGDVQVTGGPLPNSNLSITYQNNLKYTAIEHGNVNWENLEGYGVGVVITRYEKGFNGQ